MKKTKIKFTVELDGMTSNPEAEVVLEMLGNSFSLVASAADTVSDLIRSNMIARREAHDIDLLTQDESYSVKLSDVHVETVEG